MAGIDHSIYFQQKTPDVLGSVGQGMKLSEMVDANKERGRLVDERNAVSAAFKNNIDEHGNLNRAAALAGIAKASPEKYMQYKSQFQQMDLADQASQAGQLGLVGKKVDMISQGLNAVKDQNSLMQFHQWGQANGLDTSDVGEVYDPRQIEGLKSRAMTYKDQIALQMQQSRNALEDSRWNKTYQQNERMVDKKQNYEMQKYDAKKREQNYVPGLGMAYNSTDAKKLKDATEMKSKFDRQIGELISLREDKGVEYFDREAVGRGKQLSKDLLLTYKNLAKLGVLSKSDEDIINAIIPSDPLGQDWAPGQDSILHQLKSFKRDLDDDYATTLQTRIKEPEAGAIEAQKGSQPKLTEQDQQALAWAKSNPDDPRAQAIMQMHGGR